MDRNESVDAAPLNFGVGDGVFLAPEDDAVIPMGFHYVSKINEDGSFHVGGNTAVWPSRVCSVFYKRDRP